MKQAGTILSEAVTDKEVKVEKALLDLNELKSQMYEEKQNTYKDALPSNGRLNTVTNNFFRDTAYSS